MMNKTVSFLPSDFRNKKTPKENLPVNFFCHSIFDNGMSAQNFFSADAFSLIAEGE